MKPRMRVRRDGDRVAITEERGDECVVVAVFDVADAYDIGHRLFWEAAGIMAEEPAKSGAGNV